MPAAAENVFRFDDDRKQLCPTPDLRRGTTVSLSLCTATAALRITARQCWNTQVQGAGNMLKQGICLLVRFTWFVSKDDQSGSTW